MRAVLLAAALTACAYHPGSFRTPGKSFQGQRATVGCIDLAVDRRGDYRGDDEESAVLEYSFGNRCNQPAIVDLASVPVWATTTSGEQVRLSPYDPRAEISALPIEGRLFGDEVIAYPLPEPATRVCVDVASVAGLAPAEWMCFASKEPAVVAKGEP